VFPSDECGDWFVLRTRARQEKILAADLQAREIAHLLLLIQVERVYDGRRISVEMPLFQCYLFLRGGVDEAYFADRTGRVAQIITVADQSRLDMELTQLTQVIAANARLDPYPYLRKGLRVEVRSGPLRGIQGLIEERANKCRLVLQIQALGQAVSVEVDGAIVEPL
jgi:transcription antitermination factor NusG